MKISPTGTITPGPAKVTHVTTVATPAGDGSTGCPGLSGPPKSIIGVTLEDYFTYEFPGTITIQTPSIGGPSAGLAMTLTLIDQLSAGSLTGHTIVAATGTIAPNGAVGDVGGVAEKVVAVERAGATVFIVPKVEVSTARNASNGTLKVMGVTTLAQALRDLRGLGGAVPVPLTKPYPVKATT